MSSDDRSRSSHRSLSRSFSGSPDLRKNNGRQLSASRTPSRSPFNGRNSSESPEHTHSQSASPKRTQSTSRSPERLHSSSRSPVRRDSQISNGNMHSPRKRHSLSEGKESPLPPKRRSASNEMRLTESPEKDNSRSPVKRRSPSPAKKRSSPSRRRSPSADRSRYRSPDRRRSPSGNDRRRYRSRSRSSRYRRRSRSPVSPPRRRGGRYSPPRRSRYNDGRDNPEPCSCLGVFGMSLNTTERDLRRIFGEYGEIETVQLVYDRFSGRSRGFGFIYFQTTKEAMRAKEHLRDAVIDGMRVRVDFSVTKGAPIYTSRRRSRSRSGSYRRRRSHS